MKISMAIIFIVATIILNSKARADETIRWYADLKGAKTKSSGRAILSDWDFNARRGTIIVDIPNQKNNSQLIGHIEHIDLINSGDGTKIFTLFDVNEDVFDDLVIETFTGEDFDKAAQVLFNYRASVVVYTKAHPLGEISGRIEMHKGYTSN